MWFDALSDRDLAVGPFALIVPLGLGLAALNLIFWGIRRVLSVCSQ